MMPPSLPSAVKKDLKTSNFIKKFKFRPATSVKPSVLVCGWEVPSLLKDRKSWADAHVQFHKKSHCCPPKKEILLQKNKKYTSSNSHFPPPPLPFSQFCRVIPLAPHLSSFPYKLAASPVQNSAWTRLIRRRGCERMEGGRKKKEKVERVCGKALAGCHIFSYIWEIVLKLRQFIESCKGSEFIPLKKMSNFGAS